MIAEIADTFPKLQRTLTDGDGLYRFEGLDEVPYQISVQHPERLQSIDERAEVRPGANRLDLRFPAGVEVSGRALDEMGNPVAATVALLPVESGSAFMASATSDGAFRFPAVPEGDFRLAGTAPGFAESTSPDEIRVAGTPVAGLELRLSRGAVIRGRLLGIAPEQAADARIQAFRLEDGRGDVHTLSGASHAGGGYRIPQAVPGLWAVEANLADGRSASGRVRVEAAGEEAVLDLRFGPGFALTGRVLLDGEPLAGAFVMIRGGVAGSELQKNARTGHDGTFELRGLPPGKYELRAAQPPGWLATRTLEIDSDEEIEIEIPAAMGTPPG